MNDNWIDKLTGKRIWVTGASSGIGEALVKALGSFGIQTLASARREERLGELAAEFDSVHALPLDLARTDLINEKAIRAWDMLGGIDVLINNAGVSHRSSFAETDPDVLRRIIDVNLTGTMLLTRAVVPRLIAAGSGHIVCITSTAARVPTPLRSAYAAAKMGLHGLMDCIRAEIQPAGIAVTLVVPGFVRTEISENAMVADGNRYGVMDKNQAEGMSTRECATRILNKVVKRPREFSVAMNPKLLFATFMRRVLPGLFFRAISNVQVSGT